MDWLELINASRLLAGGQPTQGALRRAVSTAYYANCVHANEAITRIDSAERAIIRLQRQHPRRSAPWWQSQPWPASTEPASPRG